MIYVCSALVAVAALGLDQWVKHWVSANIPLGGVREFLPGLVELRTVHNYGAAWSSFSGMRWMLVLVTCGIVAVLLALLAKGVVRHPLGAAACALLIGGGLGNILDRVRLGYVVDMFCFQFMEFPVFNVADICIDAGCVLGAVYYVWFYEKYDKGGGIHGNADASGV